VLLKSNAAARRCHVKTKTGIGNLSLKFARLYLPSATRFVMSKPPRIRRFCE
jgi:hypothetical protein